MDYAKTIQGKVVTIKMVIPYQEIEDAHNQKLAEIQRTGTFSEYAKGTVPIAYIKKTRGRSIFSDLIKSMVNKHLSKIITKEDLEFLDLTNIKIGEYRPLNDLLVEIKYVGN